MNFEQKIIPWEDLRSWRKSIRRQGLKLVVTNGCFDLLHVGHVTYLEQARNLGDALLVGLNSDNAVFLLKGAGRPVQNESDRAVILAALEAVDAVCIFDDTVASTFLALAEPDIYVKGGDYTIKKLNQAEHEVLREVRADIKFIPFVKGKSTTATLKLVRHQ